MKEIWKKHKSEIIVGLVVAVGGGLILTAILSQQFREIAFKCMDEIQTEVSMPLYWLLIIFAFGIILTLFSIWRANKKSIEYYSMDEVQGLVWEWDYYNFHSTLKPLCPKCYSELIIARENYGQTIYFCISCEIRKQFDITFEAHLKFIQIEIEKRMRTDDWKNAEKRIKEIKNKS